MIDNNKEYILCAAIHYDDGLKHLHTYDVNTGFVIGGFRHHNIISVEPTNPIMFKEKHKTELLSETQGFITSKGRFVDRYEAMGIAYEAKQVSINIVFNKNHKYNPLFSEDLY